MMAKSEVISPPAEPDLPRPAGIVQVEFTWSRYRLFAMFVRALDIAVCHVEQRQFVAVISLDLPARPDPFIASASAWCISPDKVASEVTAATKSRCWGVKYAEVRMAESSSSQL